MRKKIPGITAEIAGLHLRYFLEGFFAGAALGADGFGPGVSDAKSSGAGGLGVAGFASVLTGSGTGGAGTEGLGAVALPASS